ncbi:MAG: hypothetical protein AAFV29_01660 [Myxococcota bacterium]
MSKEDGSDLRLRKLLLKMFSASELRRVVRYGPRGDEASTELPGVEVSLSKLAEEVLDIWRRYELIDQELMERLIDERPRRKDEIIDVFNALKKDGLFFEKPENADNVVSLSEQRKSS